MPTNTNNNVPHKEDERKRLESALQYIDADDFDQWCDVGLALKRAGGDSYYSLWDVWSMKSYKYDPTKSRRRWDSFKPDNPVDGKPITIASIFYYAKNAGWVDSGSGQTEPVKPKHKLQTMIEAPEWDPAADLLRYVKAVFKPGDNINIMTECKFNGQKYEPRGYGINIMYDDLIRSLENGASIETAIGSKTDKNCGVWIRHNPTDGKGTSDVNTTAYRYCLVESDEMKLIPQYDALIAYKLPIAAMLFSGSKSVHAIVKIDAPDAATYSERTSYLFKWMKKHGYSIDPKNGNSSRLSRMPGVVRGKHKQKLLHTEIGLPNWDAWYKYSAPVWNADAIENEPVYVCEHIDDAKAIRTAGAAAIAPKPDAAVEDFFEYLKKLPELPPLIACGRSGDPKQDKFVKDLKSELKDQDGHSIAVIKDVLFADAYSDSKTVSEFPDAYPEQFDRDVKRNVRRARKSMRFSGTGIADYINGGGFDDDVLYFKEHKDRKTGFSNIDHYMTLYPGMALLGGQSSLGKTTFAVNLSYNLAKAGETVLFYTLEEEAISLASKLVAAENYRNHPECQFATNIDIKNGVTSDNIEASKRSLIDAIGNRFVIRRCDFTITVDEITADIERYIRQTRTTPVVVLDYLQIISVPDDFRGDQRAALDHTIKKLKDLQRSYELLMIVISNMARSQYDERASYSSYKESGLAEYSSDYCWVLENALLETKGYYEKTIIKKTKTGAVYEDTCSTSEDEKRDMIDNSLSSMERKICFVSLKSRNQKQRYKTFFTYRVEYDLFEPKFTKEDEPDQNPFIVEDGEIIENPNNKNGSDSKTSYQIAH